MFFFESLWCFCTTSRAVRWCKGTTNLLEPVRGCIDAASSNRIVFASQGLASSERQTSFYKYQLALLSAQEGRAQNSNLSYHETALSPSGPFKDTDSVDLLVAYAQLYRH